MSCGKCCANLGGGRAENSLPCHPVVLPAASTHKCIRVEYRVETEAHEKANANSRINI